MSQQYRKYSTVRRAAGAALSVGGNYALSAARALLRNTNMSAREIAVEAMKIASELCVFTNDNLTVEEV